MSFIRIMHYLVLLQDLQQPCQEQEVMRGKPFGMIWSVTGVPEIFTRIPKTPASQPLQNRSSTPHSFSDQCGSRELGHLLRQVADAPLPSNVQFRRTLPKHQMQRQGRVFSSEVGVITSSSVNVVSLVCDFL